MSKAIMALVVLAALIGAQIVAASAAVVTYRLLFGGPYPDGGSGIFVDSTYIYIVGDTSSFGPNTPNLFLSIFRLDNTHKCSVAVDLGNGAADRGWRVIAYGGVIYVIGYTDYPQNVLLVKFDTNCNVLGAAVYDIDGGDIPWGLSISSDGSTLYIAGQSSFGAHLFAVRTSDFSVTWARRFNFTNPGAGDIAYSVTFSGNKLYVTGKTSTGDLFVSRFDAASGNHELSKVFSTPRYEEGRDIVVTGGTVYVAGNYDNPANGSEFLFIKLDANLNLELAKTFGTPASEEVTSLSMVGDLAYGVGRVRTTGPLNAILFAVNSLTGDISHAFVLKDDASEDLAAQDSTSTGTCLIYTGYRIFTGYSFSWPEYYMIVDAVTTGTVNFTVNTVAPTMGTPSIMFDFPTPASVTFTLTFNAPSFGDAFYSWFCPDTLVVTTTTTTTSIVTTTSTILTTSTLSTTVTSTSIVRSTTTIYDVRSVTTTQTTVRTITSSTTVYDIKTTTITQTSFVTATTTQFTTYSTTISATTTLTRSTTYSTTATQSTTTTITQSITTTLSTITTSTQYFAEPITTYVVPLLLVINTALLGASLMMGRRRKSSLG